MAPRTHINSVEGSLNSFVLFWCFCLCLQRKWGKQKQVVINIVLGGVGPNVAGKLYFWSSFERRCLLEGPKLCFRFETAGVASTRAWLLKHRCDVICQKSPQTAYGNFLPYNSTKAWMVRKGVRELHVRSLVHMRLFALPSRTQVRDKTTAGRLREPKYQNAYTNNWCKLGVFGRPTQEEKLCVMVLRNSPPGCNGSILI